MWHKSAATGSMTPTTAKMNEEMKHTKDIEGFLKKNRELMVRQSLKDYLDALLMEKNISIAEVVRGSQIDRSYVYQIFSGDKKPSRDKLLAIAFGMHLTPEETQRMLKLSGNRELYVRDERDALILFSLQEGEDILKANGRLHDHNYEILGTPG